MSGFELVFILLFLLAIWYWLDGIRAKEIAVARGKARCQSLDVYFLDESVVLTKVRIRRTARGHMALYREYDFEFTSDSERRYWGKIKQLGRHVTDLTMEPYRTVMAEQEYIH